MAIYNLGDRQPVLGRKAWVAPNATVIGDVRLGDAASIWWNAVVRGEMALLERTTMQSETLCTGLDGSLPAVCADAVALAHLLMTLRRNKRLGRRI